jgi:hypothetical protein
MPIARTLIISILLCGSGPRVASAQEGWPPAALVACPAAADTLWAADSTASPPRIWIIGAVREPCWNRFTDPMRARVWRSAAAQDLYVRFLMRAERITELDAAADTARALFTLAWLAPPVHRDVVLAYTRTEPGDEQGEYNHTPYGIAVDGLARYAGHDERVRAHLLKLLRDGGSPWVRQRALHTLMRLNDPWARSQLSLVPKRELTLHDRASLARLMADGPCQADTYWQECYGVEGQDFHGCKPPPPQNTWCAF